jgi:hypothetical protein
MQTNPHNSNSAPDRTATSPSPSRVLYTQNATGYRWLYILGDILVPPINAVWTMTKNTTTMTKLILIGAFFATLACCSLCSIVFVIQIIFLRNQQ